MGLGKKKKWGGAGIISRGEVCEQGTDSMKRTRVKKPGIWEIYSHLGGLKGVIKGRGVCNFWERRPWRGGGLEDFPNGLGRKYREEFMAEGGVVGCT